MGQTNNNDGVPGSAAVTFETGGTDGGAFYMVRGTTIPLYAQPDPVYHPLWVYGSNWSLTEGFTWTWSRTGSDPEDTGEGAVTYSPDASNTRDNYVEISIDQTGNYQIQVIEQAPVAFAGCEGVAQTLDIVVVDPPTATLGVDFAGVSESFCVGDAGIPAAINATISGGWRNYRLAWSLEIATLDESLLPDEYFTDENGAGASGLPILAVNYPESDPQEVQDAIVHPIMTVGSFEVINNKPTRYTYTLTSINDQALRFGDYIGFLGDYSAPVAGDFTYNEINETYVLTIAPAPQTQPIFHIPGAWAE